MTEVRAAIGAELAEAPLALQHVFQSRKGRLRSFLRYKLRVMNAAVGVVLQHN